MSQRFRILSLSGGGARGVFSAAALCELHDALRNKMGRDDVLLADYFDLIVGTSTGGLIALGLAFRQPPAKLLEFYVKHGPVIFKRRSRLQNILSGRWLTKPGYDSAPLRAAVEALLGTGTKLGSSHRPLVLPAVMAKDGQPGCLKTQHHDDFYFDYQMEAADAALATAAAPIFFPAVQTAQRGALLDGGLWANCPVLVGVIEAMRFFGQTPDNIDVLSIGTVRAPFQLPDGAMNGGLYHYVAKNAKCVVDLLFEGQRATAMNTARLLLGKDSLIEVDEVSAAGTFSMNDATPGTLAELERMGRQAARGQVRRIAERFLYATTTPWEPSRRP